MAQAVYGLPAPTPNLQEFSEEEERQLTLKCAELLDQGRDDDADQILAQLPIMPEILQSMKADYGIAYLISSGLNLSKAVQKYGYGWLTN